jgi:hypothetical protein
MNTIKPHRVNVDRLTAHEVGPREIFLLHGQAKTALQDFIGNIASWPTLDHFPHFKSEFEKISSSRTPQKPMIGRKRTLSESTHKEIVQRLKKFGHSIAEATEEEIAELKTIIGSVIVTDIRGFTFTLTPKESTQYLTLFFSLLDGLLKGRLPTKDEMTILLDALNQPLHMLEASPDGIVAYSLGIRAPAEHLVKYVNLVASCGLVHNACGDCGAMFIRSIGDRKFCRDCSKKHQTYAHRKEYLQQKRREYYWRNVEEERKTKQKGETHGRHDSKRKAKR